MGERRRGFLGEEGINVVKQMRGKHAGLFQLVDDVNEFTYVIIQQVTYDRESLYECVIACLFAKIIHGFQAVVLLAQYGLESDCIVVLRALLDAMFVFGAIYDDKEFTEQYIRSEKAIQLKLTNAALNNLNDLIFSDEMITRLKERHELLKKEIDEEGIKTYSSEQLARKAGLNATYQTAYRILCNETHALPISLESYLDIGPDDDIKFIKLGPRDTSIERNLCTAISILLGTTRNICELKKISETERIDQFGNRLAEFENKTQKESGN